MESAHIPGKWHTRKTENRVIQVVNEIGLIICEVDLKINDPDYPTPVASEANARLISATPDLLNALIELMKGVDSLPPITAIAGSPSLQWGIAQEAIKNATGKYSFPLNQ